MNDEIKMPISEQEAEQQYPTQYWEGTKIKRSFDMTTDDLQDAYMRGREAEPCAEQVEAVARMLFEKPWREGELAMTFDEYVEARHGFTEEYVAKYMNVARMLLDAARKAVM